MPRFCGSSTAFASCRFSKFTLAFDRTCLWPLRSTSCSAISSSLGISAPSSISCINRLLILFKSLRSVPSALCIFSLSLLLCPSSCSGDNNSSSIIVFSSFSSCADTLCGAFFNDGSSNFDIDAHSVSICLADFDLRRFLKLFPICVWFVFSLSFICCCCSANCIEICFTLDPLRFRLGFAFSFALLATAAALSDDSLDFNDLICD
mmetsp:Transcript_60883/g.96777  ORF Transcript_60883/g.96777 Transcript_60883/m.96777 type:complete len:206 (+) Transcript_60883:138-755(+)